MSGFCADKVPRCPCGHLLHVRGTLLTESVVTCTRKLSRDAPPCGQALYVCKLVRADAPKTVSRDDVVWFVTPIAAEHASVVKTARLTWLERLVLLRVTVPNVRQDLSEDAA